MVEVGDYCSNNTNKLSPQEHIYVCFSIFNRSNNTNKLSPQEPPIKCKRGATVQIIQINLALKNYLHRSNSMCLVQIIQINLALKNEINRMDLYEIVQIIQINLALKNYWFHLL